MVVGSAWARAPRAPPGACGPGCNIREHSEERNDLPILIFLHARADPRLPPARWPEPNWSSEGFTMGQGAPEWMPSLTYFNSSSSADWKYSSVYVCVFVSLVVAVCSVSLLQKAGATCPRFIPYIWF